MYDGKNEFCACDGASTLEKSIVGANAVSLGVFSQEIEIMDNEKRKEFLAIQAEVKELADRIILLTEKDEELKSLYRGTTIYFSPIQENPDIMFLGINPGAGHYNHTNNTPIYNFEPLEEMEYLSQEYNLANDWQYVFGEKNLNCIGVLEWAFKTNCFYIATDDSKKLKRFIQLSGKYLKNEIIEKSKGWTIRMIKLISPKILICEGFAAFDYLKNFLGDELVICDEESKQAGENCKCARFRNIVVFGFKRDVSSRFKDIEIVIDKIDEYL